MLRRVAAATVLLVGLLAAGCGSRPTLATLQRASSRETGAQQEALVAYGISESWGGWAKIRQRFEAKYGIRVDLQHPDWGSREIIEAFRQHEGPQADVGLVETSFARWGAKEGVLLAYQPSRWSAVPANRRDRAGTSWTAAFQGTMSFLVNTNLTGFKPAGFHALTDPRLHGLVTIIDPLNHGQGAGAVLAAAYASDTGDERNIAPGVELWRQVAQAGNLRVAEAVSEADVKSGTVGVGVLWDFNALSWQEDLHLPGLEVYLPADGTASLDYAVVINRAAPHPSAAKLFLEFILSDEGQGLLAAGHVLPVLTSPATTAAMHQHPDLLQDREALAFRPSSLNTWYLDATAVVPELWQKQVTPLLSAGG